MKPRLKKFINFPTLLYLLSLFFILSINLSFGFYHLEKKAAVDEQLWTFGRIQKYWNNVFEKEWEKTLISDKPGITVAIISGVGMKINNPLDQKSSFWNNKNSNPQKIIELEKTNKAFRSPILIFNALSLILFFFLIKNIFNPLAAIFSTAAIGFSPLILGISTIVNPDSILWIFSSFSFLSFLAYLKKDKRKYLYFSGFLLGLSVLTKYVSNIFYVFFPFIIFLEYSINRHKYADLNPYAFFKRKFKDIAILFAISFLTIFIFLPALWKNPLQIFELTIFSEAFQKIWIAYVILIIAVIFDVFILKVKIISFISKIFTHLKKDVANIILGAFLIIFLAVFVNVYGGMIFFDFEAMLASPKTSHHFFGSFEMFLASFYSLFFGINPILLFFLIFIIIRYIFKKRNDDFQVFFYILLFIFIYYIASIFNNVEATIRYQIMAIPLILIIASAGISDFINLIKNKKIIWTISFAIIIIQIASLNNIKPFYFSYSSEILPKKYSINPKDMGDGSYEAAQYLNQLPNPENLTVWSDKDGVCSFFVGSCFTDRDPENFEDFDYFVVSSGRKIRTSRLISQRIGNGKTYRYRIDKLYEAENADWKLEIGGRPNNYLKIFSFSKLQK